MGIMVASDDYIEFTAKKDVRIFAYGHMYSDRGGNSGAHAKFEKWNGIGYEQYKMVPTDYTGDKYELITLKKGKYRITKDSNYVNFDEWEVEMLKRPEEGIDIFGELVKNNKTINDLEEYGMTINHEGSNEESGYNDLYYLGQGSHSGINNNCFTLTIDYDTLNAKLGNKSFNGIYVKFYHFASTSYNFTSWVESKILVKYEDNTEEEIKTEKTEAFNTEIKKIIPLKAMFNPDKEVSQIQLIINMFDSDWGYVGGRIEYMEVI